METSYSYEHKCWGLYHCGLSSTEQMTIIGMNKRLCDEEKEEEDVANLGSSYIRSWQVLREDRLLERAA